MLTRIKALMTVVFYLTVNDVRETYPSIVRFIKTLLFASQERKKVSNQARASNSFDQSYLSFHQRHQSRTNSQQLSEWYIPFVPIYLNPLVNSTARIETT